MLKKLTHALFGKFRPTTDHESPAAQAGNDGDSGDGLPARLQELDLDGARILSRSEHCISRKQISPNALKVLYRLGDHGYQAFLVGGCIRDLMLQGEPKDFDISTDATPEQLKELFRNARIIGRRFRIVHIRFGREVIEVTTFRAHHNPTGQVAEARPDKPIRNLDSAHSSTGMLLRDNVYGSINEDALRRDFTINALYYTTNRFLVLDFANGCSDLEQRLVRIIGDPEQRYREDPVRLIRAIRFSAKLDFEIEEKTREPIDRLAWLLESVSPARLFDESLKLFLGGRAEKTFSLLCRFEVADHLFPATMETTTEPDSPASRLVMLALRNTDERLAAGKSITPAFLFAAILWPPLLRELQSGEGGNPPPPAIQEAAGEVITEQVRHIAIPRRFTSMMREIWELQWRMQPRNRRRVESLIGHPRFRAAYDFLLLREEAGEDLEGLGQWWTDFQAGDSVQQEKMIQALGGGPGKRRRKRKPRNRKGAADQPKGPAQGKQD